MAGNVVYFYYYYSPLYSYYTHRATTVNSLLSWWRRGPVCLHVYAVHVVLKRHDLAMMNDVTYTQLALLNCAPFLIRTKNYCVNINSTIFGWCCVVYDATQPSPVFSELFSGYVERASDFINGDNLRNVFTVLPDNVNKYKS